MYFQNFLKKVDISGDLIVDKDCRLNGSFFKCNRLVVFKQLQMLLLS